MCHDAGVKSGLISHSTGKRERRGIRGIRDIRGVRGVRGVRGIRGIRACMDDISCNFLSLTGIDITQLL